MDATPHSHERPAILLRTDTLTPSTEMIAQLQRADYHITTVQTECEVMALMRTTRYAAIILDIDGGKSQQASLLHAITQIDPFLPIIILITHPYTNDQTDLIKLGAFAVLSKPLQEQELTKTLDRVSTIGELRNVARHATRRLMVRAERYQSIMETARDAIILGDPEGHILSWNKAAKQMFGYTTTEVIGQPLTLLMPERYRQRHAQGLQKVNSHPRKQTTEKTYELHGLRKGGEEFPIELSLTCSPGSTEQFYCGVIRNISARRLAEMELLEHRRTLALDSDIGQALSRNQPLARLLQGCTEAMVRHLGAKFAHIWTLNQTTQVLELQASAGQSAHINGPHARIPVGQHIIGKIAETKQPLFSNTIRGDPSIPDQVWANRESFVAFAGYPLMRDQRLLGVMAMFSDQPLCTFAINSLDMIGHRITLVIEHAMLHNAHQRLSRHSEQILSSAGEGIYGLDRDCHITFINPAGARLLGYEADELIGRSVHTVIHHSKAGEKPTANECCPMCVIEKTGKSHQSDTEWFWRKDLSRFSAKYTSTPVWENQRLTGAITSFQDLTEQKRMAEQLLKETRLAEVTRALGDVAHDMKNMLMPVLSGATLIEEELREHFTNLPHRSPTETEATKNFAAEALSVVISNTRRLHNRVREIANTVKGSLTPPHFVHCRISEIVKNVIDSLHLCAREKGLTLETRELDSLPRIQADENRLFNALYNLVNNAIPETPPGGTITIAGESMTDSPAIKLTITDTGYGMLPEVRDSLFTEKAISRKAGGTGLGTKIVKDAIDDHGGTISVHSQQGVGTTFLITLPLTVPAPEIQAFEGPSVQEG